MRRLSLAMFAVLLLVLALPAVASAPIFVVSPLTPFVIAGAPEGACPFDIAVVPQPGKPNNGKSITFANGSSIFGGAAFATLTNVSNSKSINLNLTANNFSFTDNIFIIRGAILTDLPEFQLPANLPTAAYGHGQLVFNFNDNSVQFSGTAENLCDMLQ